MKFNKIIPVTLLSLLVIGCSNDGNDQNDENVSNAEVEENNENEQEVEESEETGSYVLNSETWSVVPADESDADSQVVLMTFDDAPDQHAVDIAETLYDHDVPAIFFVNGMYIEDEEGKEKLRDIHKMGFAIGNHTHTHPNLQTIPEDEQQEEIVHTNDLVEEVIGERPRFFRAPFGENTDYTRQVAAEEDMILMNWSYGYDWESEYQNPDALADIMVNTELLTDGANLLMHDRSWTSEAVEDIILGFQNKGYGFVDPDAIESEDTDEI